MARVKKPTGRRISRSRSVKDLQRTRGNRYPRKVIVIVCEGKKTEPKYFEAIRQKSRIPSLNIKVIPDQGNPISIVDRGIEESQSIDNGDEVWCVFDVEKVGDNPTFPEAVSTARRANIKLAITNPAFEYWLLLHFECTNRPFIDAEDVINQLTKYLPHYQKNSNIYETIESNTETAIQNASTLRRCSVDNWNKFPNSSTGVDKLVLEIQKMAR